MRVKDNLKGILMDFEIGDKSLEEAVNEIMSLSRDLDKDEELKMFRNMQYYMEYCRNHGYMTPHDWLKSENISN